jgi:hypothetical protein
MRIFVLALVSLCSVTLVASSSAASAAKSYGPAAFVVGATEDQALGLEDGGAATYEQMRSSGLGVVRMNVAYDAAQPTTIQQEAALRRAIAPAVARGLRVVLSVAPTDARGVTGDPNGVQRFAAYAAQVARAFPEVTDFVIGNEPNLGRFWAPTFAADGSIAAAATYEATLAASYDALKGVNPQLDVIGLALSPRGDDRPGSRRNTVSPVRFVKALGDAYRASGRTAPIMDNVGFHPYPNVNTDSPDKGYKWPNAGVPNLDRLQQAFWDAFRGTGQPTFEETGVTTPSASVRWILDETGWQTNTQSVPGYSGTENVPVVDEATQAAYHAAVVERFACDARVAALLFFHWVDESDRDRFQSGALRADASAKPAADAVRTALAGGCSGPAVAWRHSASVAGATTFGPPRAGYRFFLRTHEDASFVATATPKTKGGKPLTVAGTLKAYTGRGVKFRGLSHPEDYRFSVRFSASANPERVSTLRP